jgi:phosphate transport system permease protein
VQDETAFQRFLARRQRRASLWGRFFLLANVLALIALIALFANIANQAFGYVAVEYTVDPAVLSERPLSELSGAELADILAQKLPKRVKVVIRDTLSAVDAQDFTILPLRDVLAGKQYPAQRERDYQHPNWRVWRS